jgi:hypothetical protein
LESLKGAGTLPLDLNGESMFCGLFHYGLGIHTTSTSKTADAAPISWPDIQNNLVQLLHLSPKTKMAVSTHIKAMAENLLDIITAKLSSGDSAILNAATIQLVQMASLPPYLSVVMLVLCGSARTTTQRLLETVKSNGPQRFPWQEIDRLSHVFNAIERIFDEAGSQSGQSIAANDTQAGSRMHLTRRASVEVSQWETELKHCTGTSYALSNSLPLVATALWQLDHAYSQFKQ